jgi:hypothetical protein
LKGEVGLSWTLSTFPSREIDAMAGVVNEEIEGRRKERWGWTEGKVDPAREHIRISCVGCSGRWRLLQIP